LKALQRLAAVVTPLNDRVVYLARDDKQDEAQDLLLQDALPAQQRVLEQIDGILETYREAASQLEVYAHKELEHTITLLWLLATVVIVHSGLIATFTIRRVQRDRASLIEAHDTGARLHYMAHHDPLSGLFNRAGMSEHLKLALKQADSERTLSAALLLDLDGFKAINDTYGHETGDQLLISVAQRLANSVQREGDSVSRLAGDEFVILLCGLKSREGVDLVAERILKRLGEPHRLAGKELRVMASIGIAVYPVDADSGGALLHCADLAMYQAKQKGKSGYCHYTAVTDTDTTQLA
jgi:diguanylate cyclase (GGDEF)-like protein